MTGEHNIRYFRRRMYAVALPDGIQKYFSDTCIWTLLAWFDVLYWFVRYILVAI
jgi:hypothetical protein